ncbi:MAG: Do family serine endopeptidase [SAR324 cluster bacterium]|nr:Do family serine endopeptidase [SAR324 cluster bacterium]
MRSSRGIDALRKIMKCNNKWIISFGLLFFNFAFNVAFADEAAIEALINASKARATIVKRVQDAVVHIRVSNVIQRQDSSSNPSPFDDEFFDRFFKGERPDQPNSRKQEGMGSGSILDKNGYILTNNHVVGKADKITVILNSGEEVEAKLIGTDPPSDIAVIKIDGDSLPTLPYGDSDQMDVGESVIAIGNPFGLAQTVTFGIISAKGRSNIGITDYEDFIQTDAAINPGNSGGPLINLRGEIIGVNTAIFTRNGGYQGIGFAVPIKMARSIMEDLINIGSVSRGWLGVGIQDIDNRLAKAFGLENTNGSLITSVFEDTPAEAAGLQKGDVVIGLNGKTIRNMTQFRNEIAAARANSVVELELIRKGETKIIQVKLGERPEDPTIAKKKPEENVVLGITVEALTPEKSKQLGYEEGTGVLITKIEEKSAAAKAGLRVGNLIVEVDRKTITNIEEFKNTIEEANIEEGVLFLIRTQQTSQYIIVSEAP